MAIAALRMLTLCLPFRCGLLRPLVTNLYVTSAVMLALDTKLENTLSKSASLSSFVTLALLLAGKTDIDRIRSVFLPLGGTRRAAASDTESETYVERVFSVRRSVCRQVQQNEH